MGFEETGAWPGGVDGELTLLTDHYPYHPGEEFLAAELAWLARGFARVHVVPTARVLGAPRRMPENCVLRDDVVGRLRHGRLRGDVRRLGESLADAQGRQLWGEVLRDADLWQKRGRWCGRRAIRAAQFVGHALLLRNALAGQGLPKLVHSFWLHAGVVGAALAGYGPLAARAHGADLYRERHPDAYLPGMRAMVRRLGRLFFVSEHGLRHGTRVVGDLAAERFRLARLGVEAAPRWARGSRDGVLRILSCARALPVKRIDLLIEALRLVGRDVIWTHMGGGPELWRLQAAAATLPAAIRVRWMGEVAHEEVRAWYGRETVDVFVNTSASEGLPVSVMEALSFAIPVVAPDVGGMGELVGPECGHLLAPRPTPAAIASALQEIAEATPRTREAWARGAWQMWAAKVDAAKQYPALVRELRELGCLCELPDL